MPPTSVLAGVMILTSEVLINVCKKLGGEATNPTWIVGDALIQAGYWGCSMSYPHS